MNAQQALQEFNNANASTRPLPSFTAPLQRIWSPPPAQTWKNKSTSHSSSDMVEALAAARAISFALEIGCSPFILEGDSELVIRTLCSEDRSLAPFGHILESAKALTEANCISFSHIRRIGNSIAHNLAKHARYVSSYTVWMEDVPSHLYYVLEANNG
ncbi:hypothetical protein SO802_020206 [Lithocarpus litseifolius]|uniref:RNase H type-1 domain-containing protein n=1 Tax=Lithocarpus litseifolius TaxID=425828 RepID=A0AAW2CGL6_9ROSI